MGPNGKIEAFPRSANRLTPGIFKEQEDISARYLDSLAARRDELQRLHANTHLPKVIGAAWMYEVRGDRRYRQIARTFWKKLELAGQWPQQAKAASNRGQFAA